MHSTKDATVLDFFAGSGTDSKPFAVYGNPSDFARFGNLIEVQFFTCEVIGNNCAITPGNNTQFALDDIRVTAVPEPGSCALLLAGLGCVAGMARRRGVQHA